MDYGLFQVREEDLPVIEHLKGFIPQKVFDAHAHLYVADTVPRVAGTTAFPQARSTPEDYVNHMKPFLPGAEVIRCNFFTMPDPAQVDRAVLARANDHVFSQVRGTAHVASPYIIMSDTEETIGQLVAQPQAVAIKCYCYGKDAPKHGNLAIGEFLPEAAWVVSQQTGKPIILHMQKDRALSDPENLHYIQTMCRRYPDAKLILAHCARGFASWSMMKAIKELEDLGNIWFDLSAICECGPMAACILKNAGKRTMWGSDYPISRARGKAISLADTFYWIYQRDLDNFSSKTKINNWIIGIENLFAVRQAAIISELGRKDVEDLFYNNAITLMNR